MIDLVDRFTIGLGYVRFQLDFDQTLGEINFELRLN